MSFHIIAGDNRQIAYFLQATGSIAQARQMLDKIKHLKTEAKGLIESPNEQEHVDLDLDHLAAWLGRIYESNGLMRTNSTAAYMQRAEFGPQDNEDLPAFDSVRMEKISQASDDIVRAITLSMTPHSERHK